MTTNAPPMSRAAPDLLRRTLIGFIAVTAFGVPAYAQSFGHAGNIVAVQSDPTVAIARLNEALLAAMKTGGHASFNDRFQALAPTIDRTFDLLNVLSVSVGPSWTGFSNDQQASLLDAFRRYTVASYVASFNNYTGQTFTISPQTRPLGGGRVVVQTRITPVNGDGNELDYVMQQTTTGWKVVDVLAAGSISRVAVQRSDFRHLLSSGGSNALLDSLQRKTQDLSGGALA